MRGTAWKTTILACLLLVLGLATGMAKDGGTYRVGIYESYGASPSVVGPLASSVGAYLTELAPDSFLFQIRERKLAEDSVQAERETERAKAYAAEDEERLADIDAESKEESSGTEGKDPLPIAYTVMEASEALDDILLGLDDVGLSWFSAANDLDALLVISTTTMGTNLQRIVITGYDPYGGGKTTLLDRIAEDGRSLEDVLLTSLLRLTQGKQASLLLFDTLPAGTTIAVDDGKPTVDDHLILHGGEHHIVLSAYGYADRFYDVQAIPDTIVHMDGTMERQSFGPLTLGSRTGTVHWYVDGIDRGESTYLALEELHLPTVLVANKEGFSSKQLQLMDNPGHISFDLNPAFMDNEDLMAHKQRKFYTGLLSTILTFGIYVVESTLAKTYATDNPLWQPLLVATGGISLVTAMTAIRELAAYSSVASAYATL